MGDRQYRAQAFSLLEKSEGRPLPLVTGVMTCKNTVVTLGKRAVRGTGAVSRVPVGEALGPSSLGDPEATFEHMRNGGMLSSQKSKRRSFLQWHMTRSCWKHMKRKGWFELRQPQRQNTKVVVRCYI